MAPCAEAPHPVGYPVGGFYPSLASTFPAQFLPPTLLSVSFSCIARLNIKCTRRFNRVRLVPSLCDHFTSRPPENLSQIVLMLYSPGGRIGGINNILCAQCERSRFYMIYGILRNRGNFNENPSMRAIAKILRARASEHSTKFCEQIEQRPNFATS